MSLVPYGSQGRDHLPARTERSAELARLQTELQFQLAEDALIEAWKYTKLAGALIQDEPGLQPVARSFGLAAITATEARIRNLFS